MDLRTSVAESEDDGDQLIRHAHPFWNHYWPVTPAENQLRFSNLFAWSVNPTPSGLGACGICYIHGEISVSQWMYIKRICIPSNYIGMQTKIKNWFCLGWFGTRYQVSFSVAGAEIFFRYITSTVCTGIEECSVQKVYRAYNGNVQSGMYSCTYTSEYVG